MATSARYAALAARRTSLGGGKIRVLSPKTSTVSTIAKQTAYAQLQSMVKQYQDGIIGNSEMLRFLTSQVDNIALTPLEKVNVEDMIRDFDKRVIGDKLEANYKNAPAGSADRILAAQAVSRFYQDRANGMQSGTPAQSQALESAGTWNATATREQDAMEKQARALARARVEQKINLLPANSSEAASERAQMFNELATQAGNDGDILESNKFLAQANAQTTRADQLAAQESERTTREGQITEKKAIVDAMNTLANSYHDGKIDENAYMEALKVIEPRINTLGDTALALTFNRTSDTIAKNLEKGGLRRGELGGLPVVLGRNAAGTPTTDWDDQDKEYKDTVNGLEKKLASGELTLHEYAGAMANVLSVRNDMVQNRLEALGAKGQNERFYYEGKKQRIADILDRFNVEADTSSGAGYGDKTQDGGLGQKIADFQSGNVVPVIAAPSQFSSTGLPKKGGAGVAKVQFVNKETLPEDEYSADANGVYHKINYAKQEIPYETYMAESVTNPASYSQDKATGKYYKLSNPTVDVFAPGTSQKITVPYKSGETVPPFSTYKTFTPETAKALAAQPPEPETVKAAPAPVAPPGLQVLTPKAAPPPVPAAGATIQPKVPQPFPTITQPKPVSLPPQPGLSFLTPAPVTRAVQAPIPAPPAPSLATKITGALAPVANVLKQSPFDFLKKKLFGG